MANITNSQRVELSNNSEFKDQSRKAVEDYAIYITGQDGTTGNTAGLSPVDWAKRRFIAKSIVLHPNAQDYNEWVAQFIIFLKGQDVWTTDAATTIAAMTSGKFDELANLAFALRAERIEL